LPFVIRPVLGGRGQYGGVAGSPDQGSPEGLASRSLWVFRAVKVSTPQLFKSVIKKKRRPRQRPLRICGVNQSSGRKAMLAKLLKGSPLSVVLNETFEEDGAIVFHEACRLAAEASYLNGSARRIAQVDRRIGSRSRTRRRRQ
jgi:hypothetical protein